MSEVKATSAAKPSVASRSAAPKGKGTGGAIVNLVIVALAIVIGWIIYLFIIGDPSHFNDAGKTQPKDLLGNMYLGGFIVPFLIAMFLTLIAFIIERALTIIRATGSVNGQEFIRKVQYHLANKNVDAAIAECDKQSGSVGNVMRAGLVKYKDLISNSELSTEDKVLSIQKEVEEATALEVPMLERNLVFLSTIASAATLLGLSGTVIGMIRSFSAMAVGGQPDASKLAAGISEALFNTALGIGTSFIALIAYNFFTTIIDKINYNIDESGFTLTHSFQVNYK